MFTKEDTQYMYKSVAVPGTVRGFGLAHKRFGTLDPHDLAEFKG